MASGWLLETLMASVLSIEAFSEDDLKVCGRSMADAGKKANRFRKLSGIPF